jgi:HSP20 family protein
MNRLLEYFAPLSQIRREFDQALLGEFPQISGQGLLSEGYEYPLLNIWEKGDVAYAEAELPGVTVADVTVQVTGSDLIITGQRAQKFPENSAWQRRERPEGKFSRVVTLPWEIDAARVEAKLADGVLTIELPKSPASLPRKVKVATT